MKTISTLSGKVGAMLGVRRNKDDEPEDKATLRPVDTSVMYVEAYQRLVLRFVCGAFNLQFREEEVYWKSLTPPALVLLEPAREHRSLFSVPFSSKPWAISDPRCPSSMLMMMRFSMMMLILL